MEVDVVNYFRYRSVVKQFPFLPAALDAVEWDSGLKRSPLHEAVASIRVARADGALMASTGRRDDYHSSHGSWSNYELFIAVKDEELVVLREAGSVRYGSGYDDESWTAESLGCQLAAEEVAPDFIVQIVRTDEMHEPVRREVTIHQVRDGFLVEWSRERLHRAADELATELEAAFVKPS